MPPSLTLVLVSLLLASPALISWLWLVIMPARVAKLCPEKCQCDTGGYRVDCIGSLLNSIPSIYLTHVQTLVLHKNNITSLQNDSFLSRGLTELHYLYLSNCGLKTIELGAFNGLTKLTELIMKYNLIREITWRMFEKISNLEYLDLENNIIDHLEVDVFLGLVKLQYIKLSRNMLLKLHPDIFVGLHDLKIVALDGNRGLRIPTDRNFIISHSLSYLDISGCKVLSVSVQTFANVSKLERLDLSYNNLRTVDINILVVLRELSAMHLYGNPLQCDCQLQEVWRWCEDRNIVTGREGNVPVCDTPSEVRGMLWGVLQKRHCLKENVGNHFEYTQNHYKHPVDENGQGKTQYTNFTKHGQVPVYVVLFIFGTIGNVILLIIITCKKDMRTVPNMYILNLAISDTILLITHFSYACAYVRYGDKINSDIINTFLLFTRRLSVGLPAYSVAVLSIQRYRVTVNPLHVRVSSPPTWRVTVTTICGVWIVAALFAVPSAISKFKLNASFRSYNYFYYQRVVIFELLVSCVFPLCVIAFTYLMTARHLVESSCSISEGTQNPQLNTRRNTAKIVVGLTIVFLISFLPYHVLWTYIIFSITKRTYTFNELRRNNWIYNLLFMHAFANCMLLINSCLNPVALFCTSSPFRQHLKHYLTCFCKANSPPTDLELTRRN